MRRTTVMLSDDLARLVDLETSGTGSSLTDLVRRALEEYLTGRYSTPRKLSFIGIGAGPETDLSERVDEILGEEWTDERLTGRDR